MPRRTMSAKSRSSPASSPRRDRSRPWGRAPRCDRPAQPALTSSSGNELAAPGLDALEELPERVGELLDALALEHGRDVVVIDSGGGQVTEDFARFVEPLLER